MRLGRPDRGGRGDVYRFSATGPGSRKYLRLVCRSYGAVLEGPPVVLLGLPFPAIISGSRLYGTPGPVFSLMTWFLALGAVMCSGAVAGAPRDQRKRPPSGHRDRII
jgi:hypothetical protein